MKKLVYCLIAAMAVVLCSCKEGETKKFTRSVMLTKPQKAETTSEKRFSGIIQESREISLGFKTAGEISQIFVAEGNYVKKGQLIAELDDADYKLGVEALQVQYDQMKMEVERLEKLYKSNSISINDYEKAVAGCKQLGTQLQANKNKLEYTKLFAPIEGYVQNVNFEQKEMVDAGIALINLLDVSRMEVKVDIPLEVYLQRDNFKKIHCKVKGIDGDTEEMNIISISPKADGNQLYQMRLSFAKKMSKQITSGMNTEVNIIIERSDENSSYTLPIHALLNENEKSYVWVLNEDSTVTKREVAIDGINDKGDAIIASGLEGSESVVKAGVHLLQQGEKVNVVDNISKSNVGGII